MVRVFLISFFLLASCSSLSQPDYPKTWEDVRVGKVVRQMYDYTCGAGAIATLLTFEYQIKTSEDDVIESLKIIYSNQSEFLKKATKQGFSLFDLARVLHAFARENGLNIAWANDVSIKDIEKIPTSMIVHLNIDGQRHFAVLRGFRNGYAFLADPSRGMVRENIKDFEHEWGIHAVLRIDALRLKSPLRTFTSFELIGIKY